MSDDLRNWKERNQGLMPQADPRSERQTHERDIARSDESDEPSGEVQGEAGPGPGEDQTNERSPKRP